MSTLEYELLSLLDEGSFAEVFRARMIKDGTIVAVKRIKMRITGRNMEKVQERASQEFQLIKGLFQGLGRHDHIVEPLDIDKDDEGRICIVMALAEGGSAKAWMEQSWGLGRGVALPPSDMPLRLFPSLKAARLAMEICRALEYIHDGTGTGGLLHRDIKPGNIVFDGSGNALLADFGSAAIVDEVIESVGGSIAGTPGYSAPEIHALEPASAKSDIWSLGATLLDLLTGCGELAKAQTTKKELKNAFEGGKPWTLEGNGVPRLAPEQREAWGLVDPALRDLVSSCLVVDPDKRPTAAKLLQTPCLLAAKREFDANVVGPLKNEIKSLKNESKILQDEIRVLKEQVKEIEGLRVENEGLKAIRLVLRDDNGKQQQEIRGLKEDVMEVDELRAENERLQEQVREVESLRAESEALKKQLFEEVALRMQLEAATREREREREMEQAVKAEAEAETGSTDPPAQITAPSISLRRTLKGHRNTVLSVCFGPGDGNCLASASGDHTVKLWDAAGNCLRTLTQHTDTVYSVAFSPDVLAVVASGSADKTVKVWDVQTGSCLRTLVGHTATVCSVAFSPGDGGGRLVSGSADKKVKVWDTATGVCLRTLAEHANAVWSVAFSPDGGTRIVSGSDDSTIKLWDSATGVCLRTLTEQHACAVWSVAFSPDGGTRIVSGSEGNKISLWDAATGACLRTLTESIKQCYEE